MRRGSLAAGAAATEPGPEFGRSRAIDCPENRREQVGRGIDVALHSAVQSALRGSWVSITLRRVNEMSAITALMSGASGFFRPRILSP
jgi:hypothetical protein